MEVIATAMALVGFAGVGCLAVSNAKLWVELKAMKASTHTIEYIDPLKQKFGPALNAKEVEDMDEDQFEQLT